MSKDNRPRPMGRRRGPGLIEKPKNFKKSFKQLLNYLKKYTISISIVMFFAALSTVFAIIGPDILGDAITEIYNGLIAKITGTGSMNFAAIHKTLIILFSLYLLSCLFNFIQSFIMNSISCKIAYSLRKDISKKINRLPMKYFDKKTHGEVLSVVTNDVDTLSGNLSQSLSQIITSITTIIGVLYMMIKISGTMTLASLMIMPISLFGVMFIVSKSQGFFKKQQDYLGNVNGVVEEVYGGHEVVKAFNGEEKALESFNEYNEKLADVAWKSQFISSAMHPLMNFIGNLSYVVVSILGGYLAVKNKIEVGDIVSFTQYIRNFNQPISQLAQISSMLQSTVAASERVFEFLEEEEEVEDTLTPLSVKNIKGDIEFNNVHFGYDENKTIINDFSAKIKNGQKIAIVGPTGAGKTTMVKLLMRFYDINSGEILIDGKNIKEFKRGELRSLFGMVLQDTWLYSGTIADNIRYGKLDADIEEVKNACRAASVHHFIKTLPDNYNMVLNEETDNISQGQKQLLTIARVILADPKILILDEATSSVDTRTELLIQKAMDKLMEGRTSFIIAHRLSTIKNADLILVMDKGDIVETGNHKELLKKNGFYAKLYNSQFEEKEI
ncbi:MAG: ABC transporter ATP-binding protein [Bacilli bacterium]|nr:ABC transporter ATP-binding protein [Bacilli bacterium]